MKISFFILLVIIFANTARADINVSPMFVNFGYTKVNQMSSYATVYVNNIFNEAIQINVSHNCYQDVTVQNGCNGYLSGHMSCMINLQFRPRTLGQQNCYLDIRDSLSDMKTVSITGTGIK